MKSDLKNYVPENIEFVLEEGVKDMFPMELDFLALTEENLCGEKPLKNKADILKFVGKHFTATFPDNELVTRFLDEFEKKNIREEYCTLEENVVPARKLELEEALEKAKKMKKDAEEAYASVLMEVAKYAAEVRQELLICVLSRRTCSVLHWQVTISYIIGMQIPRSSYLQRLMLSRTVLRFGQMRSRIVRA